MYFLHKTGKNIKKEHMTANYAARQGNKSQERKINEEEGKRIISSIDVLEVDEINQERKKQMCQFRKEKNGEFMRGNENEIFWRRQEQGTKEGEKLTMLKRKKY